MRIIIKNKDWDVKSSDSVLYGPGSLHVKTNSDTPKNECDNDSRTWKSHI